ncbi:Fic family protein [Micromonospora mirobrigensis]|uniref:Fic family protein n=1 Tax=Micromonospora mirobrigensis TaxID=262898 RepID=A0A1C4VQA0_9ACTN|nr:Fic family protein [Micromonospora mirobrigensis]SCE86120.1 Fic family protein [Micromonospora mirobrigensis]
MRSFANLDVLIGQVPGAVVNALLTVDVGRGSEALYRDQLPGLLSQLANRARVASITASSAIEGVVVPDRARADRILAGRVSHLRNRSEQELAGYRDAQDYLFQSSWRPLNSGLLLHLHKMLFAHTAGPGGRFKTEDNLVVDRNAAGDLTVRFRPVQAADTPFYVSELIDRYRHEASAQRHHPVLLVGLFALDLLVIHPFEDGNGRVTRALTNALLMEAGYTVSRYVSLEQRIAETADLYYQALLDSTHGWHEDQADPWPWLGYFVDVLANAYRTFAQRAAADRSDGSKQDRVRDYVLNHAPLVFRVADIRTALPGVSDPTIRVVLDRLRREGAIFPEGLGRGATWRRAVR